MRTFGEGESRIEPGVTRRDFIKAAGAGALGLSAGLGAVPDGAIPAERSVIILIMVGGPSQLETWDPKPDAPADVRGPFGSIATTVPGVRINEYLPGLARRADRLALVRSIHHDAAPIHETGQQLLQTGRLCRLGQDHPHLGSVVAVSSRSDGGLPPFVVLPGPIGNTGVSISHGQSAGWLGPKYEPFFADGHGHKLPSVFDVSNEPVGVRDAYGRNSFGRNCLIARRLVLAGVRVVTVNMFETVFNQVSWDCHGARPFSTLDDYRRELLPKFDAAFSALIDDLERAGRLDSTLVVAAGEFGRTPRINSTGGRDHWPGVWSVALAGGGVRGGQVVGASDAHAAEPVDRPVTLPELQATIYRSLGVDPGGVLASGGVSETTPRGGASHVAEVFA